MRPLTVDGLIALLGRVKDKTLPVAAWDPREKDWAELTEFDVAHECREPLLVPDEDGEWMTSGKEHVRIGR